METRGDGWVDQYGGRENRERGLEYVDISGTMWILNAMVTSCIL